jgi:DNA-binding HxlR family transcriptional regulator
MCERSGRSNRLCLCPLEGIIDTIGKKWTLLVVNAIGNRGKFRFSQMMQELKGISPTTLTDTLQELQRKGLIRRESFAEVPPRVEYSLTQDGTQLRRAILPLLQWASTRSPPFKKRCAARYRQIPAHRIRRLQSLSENGIGPTRNEPPALSGRKAGKTSKKEARFWKGIGVG